LSAIPWSAKNTKAVPVGADKILLIDSEVAPSSDQNKLATIDSLLTSSIELVSRALLGLTVNQTIPVSDTVAWDENTIFGDATKIIDEGSGVIRLHNGVFAISSQLALDISGPSDQTAVLEWESSSSVSGPFVAIPNPAGRTASFSKGAASVTNQPEAFAIVDATASDVFVRAVLTATDETIVLSASSKASLVSFGTSVIAQTPLTNKGDMLVHNGISEQREPVGTDDQTLVADSSKPNGVKYADRGLSLIADVILGVAGNTIDVVIPPRRYLEIVMELEADSGFINAEFNFNDDFGNNYTFRRMENDVTTSPEAGVGRVPLDPSTVDTSVNVKMKVFNKAGKTTKFLSKSICVDGVDATTLPTSQTADGNWFDNAQVVKLNVSTTNNNFAIGSRVTVYGSKD